MLVIHIYNDFDSGRSLARCGVLPGGGVPIVRRPLDGTGCVVLLSCTDSSSFRVRCNTRKDARQFGRPDKECGGV